MTYMGVREELEGLGGTTTRTCAYLASGITAVKLHHGRATRDAAPFPRAASMLSGSH